jgi:hypothetical protein
MRKLLLIIGLYLILVCPTVGQKKTPKEANGLVGPVHTVTAETAQLSNLSGEWVEGDRTTSFFIVFDKDGSFGKDGNDEHLNNSPIGGCPGESKIRRDDKGREVESVCEFPDGMIFKSTFKYDDKGNVTEQANYKGGDSLIGRIVSTYDASGNMTSLDSYDSKNILTRKLTWTFDAKGNRTEWTESTRRGEELLLFCKIKSRHDDKGNVVEETQYGNPEGSITRQTLSYEFDAMGNWIKRVRMWWTVQPDGKASLSSADVEYRTIAYY